MVLTRPSPMSDDIFKGLSRQYHVKISPVDWESIDRLLGTAQYDAILIYDSRPSPAESQTLQKMFSHDSYGKIPLIVIGTQADWAKELKTYKGSIPPQILPTAALANLGENLDGCFSILTGKMAAPVSPADKKKAQKPKYLQGIPKKILVVDDDMVMLRTMNNLLKNDYLVSVAKSAAAALAVLAKQHPDLILLDYEMPMVNGPQTLQLIRSEELYKDIPVIFLTGVSDSTRAVQAMKLKPQGYLLKSMDPSLILERIQQFFESLDGE